jgi:hypothetical protein
MVDLPRHGAVCGELTKLYTVVFVFNGISLSIGLHLVTTIIGPSREEIPAILGHEFYTTRIINTSSKDAFRSA